MLKRVRATMWFAAAVIATVLVVISVGQAVKAKPQKSPASVPAPLAVGTELLRPRPVPSMTLVGEQGQSESLRSWRGKWVILAPSMTLCHEVCPMTTGVLMQVATQLRQAGLSKQVLVIEATVDPWRDTPSRLRAYRRLTGANFTMLTGTTTEIHRLWKFFGVYYRRVPQGNPPDIDWLTHKPETFDVQHTDALFLLDPAGQEIVADEGMPNADGYLPAALRRLLDGQGLHNLAHPQLSWSARQVMEDLYYLTNRKIPASWIPKLAPPTRVQATKDLTGSPRTLAALHEHAGQLLGGDPALTNALHTLHGYPVVVNMWASWCTACRSEFPFFASASARYGRKVAFLGADTNDTAGDARSFLAQHPVSYPSYQSSSASLASLATSNYMPTTVFIGPTGKVVYRHIGQYQSEAALDDDIERYALG
jgi:protein SCO1/2